MVQSLCSLSQPKLLLCTTSSSRARPLRRNLIDETLPSQNHRTNDRFVLASTLGCHLSRNGKNLPVRSRAV